MWEIPGEQSLAPDPNWYVIPVGENLEERESIFSGGNKNFFISTVHVQCRHLSLAVPKVNRRESKMRAKVTLITVFVMMVIAPLAWQTNTAKGQVVTDGLVSYWDFDHITGETTRDMWGNNDGTIVGNPKIVKGKIGEALEFDGEDDCVDCGNDESLSFDTEDPFSICAWIQPAVLVTYKAVAGKMETGWIGYLLAISGSTEASNPSALYVVLSNTNGANDIVCYTPNNSMTTDWNYVCVSYEGTSDVAGMGLYLNGENQPISTVRDGLSASMLNSTNFEIGHRGIAGSPASFNGLIDEVAVYNRDLSEDEVSQNFAAGGACCKI